VQKKFQNLVNFNIPILGDFEVNSTIVDFENTIYNQTLSELIHKALSEVYFNNTQNVTKYSEKLTLQRFRFGFKKEVYH
jgi:hypothetical protein